MSILTIYYQRNYIKYLFPFVVLLLITSIIYIWTIDRFPSEPDLCQLLKGKADQRNSSRRWWEWTCLIEQEWDKELDYDCEDIRSIGNYYICFDEPYKPKPPCLVYSFGIANDFRFDDAMAKVGCQVYSFDPSMNVNDHQRSERVQFLNMGISAENIENFVPFENSYTRGSDKTWKILTLASIKKLLGHENKTLDILKLDVETYEWAIMKQLLKDGSLRSVKQMTIEWHIFTTEPPHSEHQNMFQTYMNLKKEGFKSFYVDSASRYHNSRYFNSQADNSLINSIFQKSEK
uniref:Methyltransferase domain-containing protein n=1 Tax=Arion vulgaris TaxID=1028688 RepID=A0A0B7AYE9_9EUPU